MKLVEPLIHIFALKVLENSINANSEQPWSINYTYMCLVIVAATATIIQGNVREASKHVKTLIKRCKCEKGSKFNYKC